MKDCHQDIRPHGLHHSGNPGKHKTKNLTQG
jgi:hypothetical protein